MKRNSKPLFVGLLVVLLGFIGSSTAYFTANNTFENVFEASDYVIETSEIFESPNNWMPGDTTPKDITVTNRGTIPTAVRVWFEEAWEDKNGDDLPLKNDNNVTAAIINFANQYREHWRVTCDSNDPNEPTYYYYFKLIAPNESTTSLIQSVTFNSQLNTDSSMECTTNDTTHTQVCTSTFGGYTGGKYTLTAHIETLQPSEVENIWGTPQVEGVNANDCDDLVIEDVDATSWH